MSQGHIKQELERLRDDLQAIDASEGATPEEIQHMLSRVNNALDEFESNEQNETLLEHLQETIMQFEADHPQLIGRMRAIIDGLSRGGI